MTAIRYIPYHNQDESYRKNLFELKIQENKSTMRQSLCKKGLDSDFLMIRFSRIRTEYKYFLCEFPYSDRVK